MNGIMISFKYYGLLLLLGLCSALLLFLSLPNFFVLYGIPYIGFICIVPLLIALFFSPSIRSAFFIVTIWTVVYVTAIFFWLLNFQEMALLAYLGVLIGSILLYANVITSIKCIMNSFTAVYRPFLIAIFWVGYEYMRSRGYLAFPWALLSQASYHIDPFVQIASIGGDWLVSFMVAYTNAVLFEVILYMLRNDNKAIALQHSNTLLPMYQKPLRYHITLLHKKNYRANYRTTPHPMYFHVCFLGILFTLSFIYGVHSLQQQKYMDTDKKISTLGLQQNTDSWNTDDKIAALKTLIDTTQTALNTLDKTPDILFWSETSLFYSYQPKELPDSRYFYESNPPHFPFTRFLQTNNIPLVTGIPVQKKENDTKQFFNSAIVLSPSGEVLDSYAKNQLVPFAEHIPASDNPIVRSILTALGIQSLWTPGRSVHTVSVPIQNNTTNKESTITLGIAICFEDAFSFITRTHANLGAELLVNLSNVSWSKTKSAQVQQLIASKFRSIETGLPMIRVTNSGVNAIINPWGQVVQQTPMFETNTMFSEIPLISIPTLYRTIGDSFAILCLIGFIIIILLCIINYKKHIALNERKSI